MLFRSRDWNGAMMDLATKLRAGEKIKGDLGEYFPIYIAEKFLPHVHLRPSKVRTPKNSNSKPSKHRIEVGVACIHQDGKYLIQTRPEGKSFVGRWEFPGGKRKPGEDFRTCVKREILEELGTEISVRPHFYEELHEFEHVDLLLRFHRCQIQKGEPKALEKQKLDWVAPTNFEKIHFLDTNAGAIKKLKGMRV